MKEQPASESKHLSSGKKRGKFKLEVYGEEMVAWIENLFYDGLSVRGNKNEVCGDRV